MAYDNYDTLIRRDQLLQFVKIGDMEDYVVHGNGIEDLALAYDAETQDYKWVTSKAGSTEVISYSITMDQEQYVQKGNPVFDAINKLRKELATDASGKVLTVEMFEGDDPMKITTAPAEEMDVGIQFSTYGGASSDPLTIGYTFTSKGSPRIGVATFNHEGDTSTVTFQEKQETNE